MKKLLLWIFAFLIGCISFSSADSFMLSDSWSDWSSSDLANIVTINVSRSISIISLCSSSDDWSFSYDFVLSWVDNDYIISSSTDSLFYEQIWCAPVSSPVTLNPWSYTFNIQKSFGNVNYFDWDSCIDWFYTFDNWDIFSISMPCLGMYFYWLWYDLVSIPTPEITVYYNNWQTTSIACNWDNIITIDWLSTMSSISTFTPYFNINYTDQNNQILTDSYSNSILYLSGGQFLKTYTWWSNNDWILNLVTSEDTVFTWYLPTFDVTWNITDIDTWNVFNNFAENSLTVLLSNIPNYIQYVIMFALLLFVLWIFRRLRK